MAINQHSEFLCYTGSISKWINPFDPLFYVICSTLILGISSITFGVVSIIKRSYTSGLSTKNLNTEPIMKLPTKKYGIVIPLPYCLLSTALDINQPNNKPITIAAVFAICFCIYSLPLPIKITCLFH